jgi:hypothetical protein
MVWMASDVCEAPDRRLRRLRKERGWRQIDEWLMWTGERLVRKFSYGSVILEIDREMHIGVQISAGQPK